MFELLYSLIAISPDGAEYIQRRHLTQYQCHVAFIEERQALLWIREKHPEMDMKFRCEAEDADH